MVFNWNDEKNKFLQRTRNIGFEEIINAIENDKILDILENPGLRYKNQIIIIVDIEDYAYAVPALKNEGEYFLKTIFPSRKFTNKYLKNIKEVE